MEKNFTRVQSVKDIAIFSSLIIIGFILAFLPESEDIHLAGYTVIAIGIMTAFILKSAYKDTETKEKYYRKNILFSSNMKASIISAMNSTFQPFIFSERNKGQELKLEIYYSGTSKKAYIQLFEYVPHQYIPCSKMHELEISQVKELLK